MAKSASKVSTQYKETSKPKSVSSKTSLKKASSTVKGAYVTMSRMDEKKALQAQSLKIRKDPSYGLWLAQKAGIIDKNGKLTAAYKTAK